jgi:hypothetical protein
VGELRYVVGSNNRVNGSGSSSQKNSSGVLKGIPTLAAKSLSFMLASTQSQDSWIVHTDHHKNDLSSP